ncbi:hypothetical protein V495_07273 [Pseudogymnoascus sp. VKM F-4514 (FW-929)]|nr:hypothetical protein V495_07273 [Pseudogymnoascus sp. VKM F-4514 (FW-929)]
MGHIRQFEMAVIVWSKAKASSPSNGEGSLSDSSSGTATDKKVNVSVDSLPLAETAAVQKYWWSKKEKHDPDAIATQPSVYDDPDVAKLYQPRDDYENLHRFDPTARWTWREEWAVVRKVDIKILIFACVAFMALELDRANLSQALTDNFLADLHMNTNDYNLGNTVFRLAFLCAELPSQLVSKWIGPDRWIPMQMVLWSIVAASQYSLAGRTSFLTCRALLAILQGGFIPDMILYLSYFYTSRELPIRLSIWWTMMSVADILASFIAFGILHMRGVNGQSGWRWLFLIEGIFTGLLGIAAIFLMPPSPTQTASKLRGKKGWFTAREETIIVTRALRDDPSKGSMHNRQPITPKLLYKSLSDYHLWPMYLVGLTFQLPTNPPHSYLTLSLRNLGFDTFQTNLLVIPSQVGHIITMLGITLFSDYVGKLAIAGIIGQIWVLPFLVSLYIIDSTTASKWTIWAITTLLLSYPNTHAVQVGWISRNSNTVRLRTVSAAMYNMFVQAQAVIGANVYREDDKPRYRRGNRALVALNVTNVAIYTGVILYYKWVNKKRDDIWNSWTDDEKEAYILTTKDEGNKRMDFRFVY